MSMNRIQYLDLAKGICMILVVMCHVNGVGHSDYSIYPDFCWLFMLPCFFIISGYFFSCKKSFWDFLLGKTRQLLIPYFIFLLPVILYNFLWGQVHDVSYSIVAKTSSVHNDPLWFIFSLYIMVIIYYGLTKNLKNRYVIGAIVIGLSIAGVYIRSLDIVNIKWTNALEYMVYLWIGNLWKSNKLIWISRKWVIMMAFIVYSTIAIPYQLFEDFRQLVLQSPLYFLGAISGTILMIKIAQLLDNVYILNFIGKNSLIILCVHQYILFLVCRLSGFTNPWIQLVFTIALLLIISESVNRYAPWLIGKKKQ